MDLSRLMSRLAAIGGMQGAVTEAEEKCPECGKVHEGDCDTEKVEEAKKTDDKKDGPHGKPAWLIAKEKEAEAKEEVKEDTTLAVLRQLAGIKEATVEEDDVEEGNDFAKKVQDLKAQGAKSGTKFKTSDGKEHILECGDEYEMGGEMSPMSITATEMPGMGVPAQVMGMDTDGDGDYDEPGETAPKAKYTLSIQNGENNLQMTTDMPDEIIHIMKLAGVNKGAEVTKTEAPESDEEQSEAPKKEVEEDWGNTPSQTKEREPKAYGDIRDWGMKGTGKGQSDSASRKPFGQGDNPLGEQAMMEAYKKFKASK
jgi:hypothetical protein